MHLVIRTILVLLTLFILPDYVLSDMYKCKDKNGHFHIADHPSKLPKDCIEQSTYTTDEAPRSSSARESSINNDVFERWRKMLPGIWEIKGEDSGEPYVTTWEIFPDGRFTANTTGQAGQETFTVRFSGTWKISNGNLISTYTWSSFPALKPGTQDVDEIIELSKSFLVLKEGKSGSISKYTKKSFPSESKSPLFKGRLSSLTISAKSFGEEWSGPTGLVVDDVNNLV